MRQMEPAPDLLVEAVESHASMPGLIHASQILPAPAQVMRQMEPPPDLLMPLLPFQKEFLAWAVDQVCGPNKSRVHLTVPVLCLLNAGLGRARMRCNWLLLWLPWGGKLSMFPGRCGWLRVSGRRCCCCRRPPLAVLCLLPSFQFLFQLYIYKKKKKHSLPCRSAAASGAASSPTRWGWARQSRQALYFIYIRFRFYFLIFTLGQYPR